MFDNKKPLFPFIPIIPHLLIISIALGAYYYIFKNSLFLDWLTYLYYGLKTLIAFEIILASARSFLAPTLGIVAALSIVVIYDLFNVQFDIISISDGWQLLITSIVGLLISVLMKL